MVTITQIQVIQEDIRGALEQVSDPEIPVLSVLDLGVIRDITMDNKHVVVDLTPTYSGCPAMDAIGSDLKKAIDALGYTTTVNLVLSPAWSTDWISDAGRKKLEEYGIAPPMDPESDKMALLEGKKKVKCTRCGSVNTKMISQFGSTACKALFQCEDCLEPFDYFKCLK